MLLNSLIIDITVRYQEDHSKTFSLLSINLLNEKTISALHVSAGASYSLAAWAAHTLPCLTSLIKEHLDSNS